MNNLLYLVLGSLRIVFGQDTVFLLFVYLFVGFMPYISQRHFR